MPRVMSPKTLGAMRGRLVADLIPIQCEPVGEDIATRLNEVWEKHDEGLISSIAIAVVYRDGSTSTSNSNAPSIATLIGAVARLQARLIGELPE